MTVRIRWTPAVPELRALGFEQPEGLLGGCAELLPEALDSLGARAQLVQEAAGRSVVRYPLPGTPDQAGLVHERPRGAGTGWVWLVRYQPAPGGRRRSWRARITAPRSTSLAAREWNLFCCLQAAGVATPELLAVGEESSPVFAARSFLVMRELEGWQRLDGWLSDAVSDDRRRRAATALGATLGALARSGARLPELSATELWIAESGQQGGACALEQIAQVRAAADESPLALPRRRLPGIAISSAAGGGLGNPLSGSEPLELLRGLEQRAPELDARFARRVARQVLGPTWRSAARPAGSPR